MFEKNLIFLAHNTPPATPECPEKIPAQSVQQELNDLARTE